ncbi:MAG: SHOCT domain-containing protein [Candidatus Andersenbacteria bacterium]
MPAAIFEAKYLGAHISVFPDRVDWKVLSMSHSVPIASIASVELPPLYNGIHVLTTGGKRYTLPTGRKHKRPLHDAIVGQLAQARGSTGATPASSLDELKKLAELHDAGVVTEEEFQAKKKELLGG